MSDRPEEISSGSLRIRERVDRLSAAIEKTSDGIFITEPSGTIVYVNRAFERQTGYSREEAVGATPRILKSGHHEEAYYEEMWDTLLAGREWRGTILNRRKDGGVFWGDQTITPVLASDGRIRHFVSVIRDVTEREAQLRYERDFNAAIVSTAGALVLVTDAEGCVIRVNDACVRTCGHGREEIIGRSAFELPMFGPGKKQWGEQFERCLGNGEAAHAEFRLQCKDGGEVIVLWTFKSLRDERGEVTHVVASGVDVTEGRAAREVLEHRVVERTRELEEALHEVRRLKERLEAENVRLREEVRKVSPRVEIVGVSAAIRQAVRQMERVARTDSAVLLLGETGTGKGLFAKALHETSPLRDEPLVTVDCTTLPETLIESELFGHEKGAFTGAVRAKPGRFELADGGTIFLDEIGDFPLPVQAKLLRILQSGEFERVGSNTTRRVHVRLIAATNRDLRAMTETGKFRSDLYFRLSVVPVRIPPLRERKEDIPGLVSHFLRQHGWLLEGAVAHVPQSVFDQLSRHDWPGNVRELENTIQRALILSTGGFLTEDSVRNAIESDGAPRQDDARTLEEHERNYIVEVLHRCGWRVKGEGGAADLLGLSPSTLRDRIRRLNIRRSSSRF